MLLAPPYKIIFPDTATFPTTSSFSEGLVVPIPTVSVEVVSLTTVPSSSKPAEDEA